MVLLHCEMSTRLTSEMGHLQKSPSQLLCHLSPIADAPWIGLGPGSAANCRPERVQQIEQAYSNHLLGPRKQRVGGTSRPNALAALGLRTNSDLVGICISNTSLQMAHT
jgi:hypothetical protein